MYFSRLANRQADLATKLELAAARRGWDALVWPLGPVRVTLGKVVPMGDPRRYSALSAVLDEGREPVESAIGACRDVVCDAAGAARERRAPKAHLTVARPGRAATDQGRADGLAWASRVMLAGVALRLDRVALYGWSDDRSDRKFRIVEERTLAP